LKNFGKKANSLRSENDFKRIVGTRQDWRCRDGFGHPVDGIVKALASVKNFEKSGFISGQNFEELR
jgi:hypothetical protein